MTTARDTAALNFIRDYIETNHYPPTVREVTQACGATNPSVGHEILSRLERQGLITRSPGIPRSITVAEQEKL